MDYSKFRRSENVEQPQPVLDPLTAMLFNPLRSQWVDPMALENRVKFPELAMEFPYSYDPKFDESHGSLARAAGLRDVSRMVNALRAEPKPQGWESILYGQK